MPKIDKNGIPDRFIRNIMVFQLLICFNLIAPLVKADFAVASQDPKESRTPAEGQQTNGGNQRRFVGLNGATDRCDINLQRFGCQDLFCPAESTNVKEQKGQRQTLRRVLKFAVWLLRNTAQKHSRKQRICNKGKRLIILVDVCCLLGLHIAFRCHWKSGGDRKSDSRNCASRVLGPAPKPQNC